MFANYHTHTFRCHHATGTEREYIEAAIAEGIKVLGFSDHIPCLFPDGHQSGFRVQTEDTEDYFTVLRALRKEYKDDIEIHIGFESEYYPELFDSMIERIKPFSPEYLILGQHCTDNERGHWSTMPTDDPSILTEYVNEVIEGIKTGAYTYLAHPDMINFVGDPDFYHTEIKRLCETAKVLNIPLEFNMLGFRSSRNYPNVSFLKTAAEVGNDYIIGLDAHAPEHIKGLERVKEAENIIKGMGLNILKSVQLRDPIDRSVNKPNR